MKINLRQIDGKVKEFSTPYVSALAYRKYMDLKAEVDYISGSPTVKQLDKLMELVVQEFHNQFTIDELYAGLTTQEFREMVIEFVLRTEGVPLDEELELEEEETKKEMDKDATP
jgi:hypothetical protein